MRDMSGVRSGAGHAGLNRRERSIGRWGVPQILHKDLNAFFRSPMLGRAIHTIYPDDLPIDIYCDLAYGRPLIVSFHGAVRQGDNAVLPFFSGLDLSSEVAASLVSVSDPALQISSLLRLGWFAGTVRSLFQSLFPALLEIIIQRCRPSSVIFFGGSAGGFAALYFSGLFKGSVCLVWNPQIDLLAYNRQLVGYYCRLAFGLRRRADVVSRLGEFITHDVTSCILNREASCRIIYLQNASDAHRVSHAGPLLYALCGDQMLERDMVDRAITAGFFLFIDRWGDGHVRPPRLFLQGILKRLVSAGCESGEVIEKLELRKMLAAV
jgi:hypothetical protein